MNKHIYSYRSDYRDKCNMLLSGQTGMEYRRYRSDYVESIEQTDKTTRELLQQLEKESVDNSIVIIHFYGLFDPRDGALRYIGQTRDMEGRLKGHIREAMGVRSYIDRLRIAPKKSKWILELLDVGLEPVMLQLEAMSIKKCDKYLADRREKEIMQVFHALGYKLFNSKDTFRPLKRAAQSSRS